MFINVYEIKSKENVDKIKSAVVYCHGGGAIAGKAEDFSLFKMFDVLKNDVIYYNVD